MTPDPTRGRSHQQLRLKILSRREKLGFMARTVRGRGTALPRLRRPRRGRARGGGASSRGGTHRWSAPPPRSPQGRGLPACAAQALGRGPTARCRGKRPTGPQLAAYRPGKAICCEFGRCREARAARTRSPRRGYRRGVRAGGQPGRGTRDAEHSVPLRRNSVPGRSRPRAFLASRGARQQQAQS